MMPKIIDYKLLATTVLAICAASFSAKAQSSSSGSMVLDNLFVSPASGTITWSSTGWSLGAVSVTGNSDGELDPEFNFASSPGTASASSSVTYASASDFATATSLDASGISGQASGSVNIPGGINESAFVSGGAGNYASLETQFTLSQDTSVSLNALFTAAQDMETDAGGQVLENEVIFNLNVDSSPALVYDNPLSLGPSASYSTGVTTNLSASVDLSAGSHDLYIELDSEQQVLETTVPDHGRTCLLLLSALGLLAAVRAICGTGSSSEQKI